MGNTKRTDIKKNGPHQQSGIGKGNSQLENFFWESLKDIYGAEKQFTNAFLKIQKVASSDELKSAIVEHIAQIEDHVTRLEKVFGLLGKRAVVKKSTGMEGIIKESNSIMDETEEGSMTREVAMIMAAQKIVHYEIAIYVGLICLAKTLRIDEASEFLQLTLDEEKQIDQRLTLIATEVIDWEAELEPVDERSLNLA